ncbi:hypothetical protein FHS57_005091 [Runella defluvii]|uniref:Uncharacterized protein n=1 Tax=Runella defluvii TaxID=370973 RepID=A0A7W5ZP64_9BACT|nr:hypothetical protein [Runella defluvii]
MENIYLLLIVDCWPFLLLLFKPCLNQGERKRPLAFQQLHFYDDSKSNFIYFKST